MGLRASQLVQPGCDLRKGFIQVVGFVEESFYAGAERSCESIPIERPNERLAESLAHFCRQIIEPATVERREIALTARETERVIARGAEPILCLPETASFDADPSANRVMDGVTNEFRFGRRLNVRFVDGSAGQ